MLCTREILSDEVYDFNIFISMNTFRSTKKTLAFQACISEYIFDAILKNY